MRSQSGSRQIVGNVCKVYKGRPGRYAYPRRPRTSNVNDSRPGGNYKTPPFRPLVESGDARSLPSRDPMVVQLQSEHFGRVSNTRLCSPIETRLELYALPTNYSDAYE